jgi:hypothetical protein
VKEWVTTVNLSPVSPKLFRTYPHREEDQGIGLAPLFLWLVLLKLLCNQLKVFYLLLKKFDTKINAILVISELMASAGKVLWRFRRQSEKIYNSHLLFESCRWQNLNSTIH